MDVEPTMGAEDFSFMLQRVRNIFFLGNGDIAGSHRGKARFRALYSTVRMTLMII